MWQVKENQALLDRTLVRKTFRSTTDGKLTLICPKKNNWDWEDNEKWLRSVVVDENGKVVSCGWPKFGNYGEFINDTAALDKELVNGEVLFTEKCDGSLAIRSVINGEVIFRTRGTLFGGEVDEDGKEPFGSKFKRAAQKYPHLLDPNWHSNISLLFEYVSPHNKIVLRYDFEDLIFLGFVRHNLTIGKWCEVRKIAEEGNLRLVKTHELPREPQQLLEVIKTWEDEGVVVRCCDSQVMVKVKSASYLCKHRLISNMTYNFVIELIDMAQVKNEDQFVEELKKNGLDFETIQEGIVFYKRYEQAVQKFEAQVLDAHKLFESFYTDAVDAERRKQFATLACKQVGIVRPLMFAFYDGKDKPIHQLRKKAILDG